MLLLISITAGLRASEVCVTADMFLGMRCECLRVCCEYVFVPPSILAFITLKIISLLKPSEPAEPLKTLPRRIISIYAALAWTDKNTGCALCTPVSLCVRICMYCKGLFKDSEGLCHCEAVL